MRPSESRYVSHRPWGSFILGTLGLVFGSLAFLAAAIQIFEGKPLNAYVIFFFGYWSLVIVAGPYLIHEFNVSRRVEFHDNFIRVSLPEKTMDIPYAKIKIGPAYHQYWRGPSRYFFRIYPKGMGATSWKLRDGWMPDGELTLYSWLDDKGVNQIPPRQARA